jgi:hypothetical protein
MGEAKVYLATLSFTVEKQQTILLSYEGSQEEAASYIVRTYIDSGARQVELIDLSEAPADLREEYLAQEEVRKKNLN